MAADTPPDPKFIFFDCDDTLYRNDWKTGDRLTQKIAQYTESELGVDGAKAYELYKAHGTCLKGLLAEGLLPRERIDRGDLPPPEVEQVLTGVQILGGSDQLSIELGRVLRRVYDSLPAT